MVIDNVLFALSYSTMAAAPTLHVLLAGRVMSGYALASAFATVPIYLSEVPQTEMRASPLPRASARTLIASAAGPRSVSK